MRFALSFVASFVLAFGATAVAQDDPQNHTTDSIDVVKNLLKDDQAVLLDVRTPEEWAAGHLKSAKHLQFEKIRDGVPEEDLKKIAPKDKVIYTHCKAGRRALGAARLLKKLGYDVRALKPGYEELLKEGLEKAE